MRTRVIVKGQRDSKIDSVIEKVKPVLSELGGTLDASIKSALLESNIELQRLGKFVFCSKYLFTKNYPDPDLLIRTGNTKRLSNFLLWQLAYSEIFFEKKLWPDFNEKDYNKIIKKYKNIKRNFGNI